MDKAENDPRKRTAKQIAQANLRILQTNEQIDKANQHIQRLQAWMYERELIRKYS